MSSWDMLNEAYDRCGKVCADYAKTFYLVWCRRVDELVDGPNASHITPKALDRWETRLNDLFQGQPYDMYDAALSDVGEDARRGRIYLPQDELALAGLTPDYIFSGKVTNKWRSLMKGQIKRARMFFDEAEKGVAELSSASRWPVWASLLLYRQILDAIEANDCDSFTKRAYVRKANKLVSLPVACGRAVLLSTSSNVGELHAW